MPYWFYIELYITCKDEERKRSGSFRLRYIDMKIFLPDLNSRTVQVNHAYEMHIAGKSYR